MRDPKSKLDRRTALVGAGAVGAAAAAAALLPGAKPQPTVAPADAAKPPEGAAGYRLTEHIARYYATARI
jgi:hypothetical protein